MSRIVILPDESSARCALVSATRGLKPKEWGETEKAGPSFPSFEQKEEMVYKDARYFRFAFFLPIQIPKLAQQKHEDRYIRSMAGMLSNKNVDEALKNGVNGALLGGNKPVDDQYRFNYPMIELSRFPQSGEGIAFVKFCTPLFKEPDPNRWIIGAEATTLAVMHTVSHEMAWAFGINWEVLEDRGRLRGLIDRSLGTQMKRDVVRLFMRDGTAGRHEKNDELEDRDQHTSFIHGPWVGAIRS